MVKPILTLDEAKAARLEVVIVCRNPRCRHRASADLDLLIHHVGAAASMLPVRGQIHFSDRMRCSQCGTKGVLMWPTEMHGPEPLFETTKGMAVHTWQHSSFHTVVARVLHINVAHAAFDAAVAAYPGHRVTLQEGMRVIRDDRFRILKGGKL